MSRKYIWNFPSVHVVSVEVIKPEDVPKEVRGLLPGMMLESEEAKQWWPHLEVIPPEAAEYFRDHKETYARICIGRRVYVVPGGNECEPRVRVYYNKSKDIQEMLSSGGPVKEYLDDLVCIAGSVITGRQALLPLRDGWTRTGERYARGKRIYEPPYDDSWASLGEIALRLEEQDLKEGLGHVNIELCQRISGPGKGMFEFGSFLPLGQISYRGMQSEGQE